MPGSLRAIAVLLPSVVVVALTALTLSLDACGTDATTGGAPPPLPTGKPSVRDASLLEAAPALIDASPAPDASAPARHFTGTLAASAVTAFGGSPYCKYTITLKQIDVDVTVSAAGDLAGASVTDLAVEANVQPCPNAPADPTIQKYTLASSLRLPTGRLHLELAPDPANHPVASLVLEGDFGGDHVMASLEWHRTDQQPPLDWRVTAGVPLDRH